jgi:ABC-type phosphate/phosphonate transport system permease subunit
VLAATAGGEFRVALLLLIAVGAGAFACILALPAHSLQWVQQVDVR